MKEYISGKLSELSGLSKTEIEGLFEVPPEQKLGDLAFPCFVLAKTLRKAPPLIAKELAEGFAGDELLEKVEAVGGYLNFFYKRSEVAERLVAEILEKGTEYAKSELGKGKTVLVEYSSPNIAKPFHIGHLFSTAVANSLS